MVIIENLFGATRSASQHEARSHALRESDLSTAATAISAANLMNQQIWCWGRDIECPDGNLLVHFGFQRLEKPPGSNAASLYLLDIPTTARIVLRGFGVFYGDERWGGLFLHRYAWSPRLTPAASLLSPAWNADDLPELHAPRDDDFERCQRLLLGLVDWIHQYEVRIVETKGIDYRRQSLLPWKPKRGVVIPAEELSRAWRLLGVAIAEASQDLIPVQPNRRQADA